MEGVGRLALRGLGRTFLYLSIYLSIYLSLDNLCVDAGEGEAADEGEG